MHVMHMHCWTTNQPPNNYRLPIVYEYHYCLINKPKGVQSRLLKQLCQNKATLSLYPKFNLRFTTGVSVGRIGGHEHSQMDSQTQPTSIFKQ